jgi:Uma2 family endonuclease
MTVAEKPPLSRGEQVRDAVRCLQPGESFALDHPITVDEFCRWMDETVNAELVNGIVTMKPPPTDAHEDLFGWLFKVFGQYVEQEQLGKVRGSRSGVEISPTSLREPDILFFSNARLDRIGKGGVHGAPDCVIEIVDSNKARRDAVSKQAQYEEIGVGELWVVDLPRKELRHFLLETGRFQQLPVDPGGEAVLRLAPGFRLRVAWLFQGPDFPRSLGVVNDLLAAEQA